MQLWPVHLGAASALRMCVYLQSINRLIARRRVVYPLDVYVSVKKLNAKSHIPLGHSAKTRIQASSKGKGRNELSMIAVLLQIYKKEGIMGWYRGFAATMLNTFSMRMYPILHFALSVI